jgi:hypothetical protein
MTLIPHKVKMDIIRVLVKPETLEIPRAWGREIKMFNQLLLKYPDEKFWKDYKLEYQLNSIAWLKGGGKEDLEIAWRYYKITNSKNNSLDSTLKAPTISN